MKHYKYIKTRKTPTKYIVEIMMKTGEYILIITSTNTINNVDMIINYILKQNRCEQRGK